MRAAASFLHRLEFVSAQLNSGNAVTFVGSSVSRGVPSLMETGKTSQQQASGQDADLI